MIRAVVFDMYETLITHYKSPLYFGAHMAKDAEIPEDKFFPLWRGLDHDRTIGKLTLEELLEQILRENDCYSKALLNKLVAKRVVTKEECFKHLHAEIIPMLTRLKEHGLQVGLISNCYAEEAKVIRESELFPFFDRAYLSWYESRTGGVIFAGRKYTAVEAFGKFFAGRNTTRSIELSGIMKF